jgi:hypothetical protein
MGDKTWKQTERAIAKRLQGQRVGNRGAASPDVVGNRFVAEVKTRKTLPAWLKEAVHQAEAGAVGDRLPLVVLHEAGTRHDGDIVCLRLADLERLLGELGYRPGAPGDEHSLTLNSGSDHDGR